MNRSAKDAAFPKLRAWRVRNDTKKPQSLGVLGMFGGALKAKQPDPFESGCC
jgi:hypothetical protein